MRRVADLQRIGALARDLLIADVLDLGCGGGHVSYALAHAGVGRVVAFDLTAEMLGVVASEAATRGHTQIETHLGSAQHLAFEDACFDMVVTRYSAHHWPDVGQALGEVFRVLRPGGLLVVIDVISPEIPLLDTVLQTVEILRDESHVRDYRASEWRAMLTGANFSAPEFDQWRLPMEFNSWVARIGTAKARIDALKVVIDALPQEARRHFDVAPDHSFSIDVGWFQCNKSDATLA